MRVAEVGLSAKPSDKGHEQFVGVLHALLEDLQEVHGIGPVQHPVVDAQHHGHDKPGRDRQAFFSPDDGRLQPSLSEPKDRDLRMVDDRRERPSPERAGVGDGKRSALELLQADLACMGPLHERV